MAVILDGATARAETGCVHGVVWYVRHLAEAINAHADLLPPDALALAIRPGRQSATRLWFCLDVATAVARDSRPHQQFGEVDVCQF